MMNKEKQKMWDAFDAAFQHADRAFKQMDKAFSLLNATRKDTPQ